MWTDGGPARQMRAALRASLPPRAMLKRDRGDALFITNAPEIDPSLRAISGFVLLRRGGLWAVLPDESWIARMERRAAEPPNLLCAQLLRFRGEVPDLENLKLFVRGAKLLDERRPPLADVRAYDRALRQQAALALRGGCGGGLYAAALLLHRLSNLCEEETQP